jgi:hypothetical protein
MSRIFYLAAVVVTAIASTGCDGSGPTAANAGQTAIGPPPALKKAMEEGTKALMANKKKPRSMRPPLGPMK